MLCEDVIRIVVAEDHPMIRHAFVRILSQQPNMAVVGEAADGTEAIQVVRAWRPDIVLMDVQMPRTSGIAATRQIMADCPDTKIVIITSYPDETLLYEALLNGAQGYVLKDISEADLIYATNAVFKGEAYLSPSLTLAVLKEFRRAHFAANPMLGAPQISPLSLRESRVLQLVSRGLSNKQIAHEEHLAEGTVKNYVSHLMEKAGVRTRTELAVFALSQRRF
jgi:DNA-binding NarL/FixJ family response regulator